MEGSDDAKKEEKPPRVDLNYKFMDGLRGFGAFAVYIHHFYENFFFP